MSNLVATVPLSPTLEPSRRALAHLFDEYQRARGERDAADTRLARYAETIRLLLSSLPLQERGELEQKFRNIEVGIVTDAKGGHVFNNVIALFARDARPEWTVSDVQLELNKDGYVFDQKAIYNSIAYLARSGRLRRISRGRYAVKDVGAGIDIDNYEDGTARLTEHDV